MGRWRVRGMKIRYNIEFPNFSCLHKQKFQNFIQLMQVDRKIRMCQGVTVKLKNHIFQKMFFNIQKIVDFSKLLVLGTYFEHHNSRNTHKISSKRYGCDSLANGFYVFANSTCSKQIVNCELIHSTARELWIKGYFRMRRVKVAFSRIFFKP